MTAQPVQSPASPRILSTPYARRLARERGLSLAQVAGSGPNGRVTGDDVAGHRRAAVRETPPAAAPEPVAATAAAPATAAASTAVRSATPSAIAARVEFGALDALLAQLVAAQPGLAREDLCLKAAASAFQALGSAGSLVLLGAGGTRIGLAGVGTASVSAVAAMRAGPGNADTAALAVSFIARPGIRPVAARLPEEGAARLVVGAPDRSGGADCLLAYDAGRIADEDAESALASFRDLVETPLRLLV